MKVINNFNLNYKQLKNAVIEKLATAPTTGLTEGLVYYNTTENAFYIYRGTTNAWSRLDSQSMSATDILNALTGVDGTGSGLDADLLDGQNGSYYLNTSTPLNSVASPIGAVSLNNQKITSLGAPTDGSDATTKTYVDTAVSNAIQGLDIKASVFRISIAEIPNVTYSSAGNGTLTSTESSVTSSFDGGVNLNIRVLIKDQSVKSQNGLYTVTSITSGNIIFTRTDDMKHGTTLNPNSFVFVEDGTIYADTGWVLTSNGGQIGVTNSEWVQFSAAGVIEAGSGLTKTGQTLSIDTTVVARKKTDFVPSGSTTASITHNFNTKDIVVSVIEVSTGELVLVDAVANGVNTCQIIFDTAPTSEQYRYIIVG
jgi:hypothetical protein